MTRSVEIRVRCDHYVSHSLTQNEICELTGATETMIARMIDEGILRSMGERFEPTAILEVEKYLRLHNDLGVNWSGIAVIDELIDRLKRPGHFESGNALDVDFEDV